MSYVIGIDFGTTNSTVAFFEKTKDAPIIKQFSISQLIEEDLESEVAFLPSSYLFPLNHTHPVVGMWAKKRGSELPDRVISSAKSWLAHDLINRRHPFLPLSDFSPKVSPLSVCATLLAHLKEAWTRKNPHAPFEKQNILITVPASFDPSARQLILEAAELAQFPQEIILMEEPLAAFYAWIYEHEKNWRDFLKVGDNVLVVDIGGGTTDFSLIAVEEQNQELALTRKAVGNHLLLGGDNLDLTLAYYAQNQLNYSLDAWQFQNLIHACRNAKEELLSDDGREIVPITVQSKGSRLIGGTISTNLHKKEVRQFLQEGFFPSVNLEEKVIEDKKKVGIANLALPFVKDPRVTAHLAQFLQSSGLPLPTRVLFNGGTMKSKPFCMQIVQLLSSWKGQQVEVLPDVDLDFAVGRGAAYYGWVKEGHGIRVRAGISCSYYIGVESPMPAVPGIKPPIHAICVAPLGMEEGTEATLEGRKFSLQLDELACFRFFSSTKPYLDNGQTPQIGTTLYNCETILTELHPIETILESSDPIGTQQVLIELQAKITELGILELWCVADDSKKWKLEFDLRASTDSNKPL